MPLKKLFFVLFMFLVGVPHANVVADDGLGTEGEARALAVKAAALISQQGRDVAFRSIDAGGEWRDRDLYVGVIDETGLCVADSRLASMKGKKFMDLRDADGKYIVREFFKVNEAGWVSYRWPNPVTKQVREKTTYVIRFEKLFIFAGAYK